MLVTSSLGYSVKPHYLSQTGQFVTTVAPPHPSINSPVLQPSVEQYKQDSATATSTSTTVMINQVNSAEMASGVGLEPVISTVAASTPVTDIATINHALSDFSGGPIFTSTSPVSNGSPNCNLNNLQQQQVPGSSSPHPNNIHSTAEYLQQLLKDRARLSAFPGTFLHAERLLELGKSNCFINSRFFYPL